MSANEFEIISLESFRDLLGMLRIPTGLPFLSFDSTQKTWVG